MKLITGADSDGGLRLVRERTELFEFKFKPQLQIKQSGGYSNIEGKGAYTLAFGLSWLLDNYCATRGLVS